MLESWCPNCISYALNRCIYSCYKMLGLSKKEKYQVNEFEDQEIIRTPLQDSYSNKNIQNALRDQINTSNTPFIDKLNRRQQQQKMLQQEILFDVSKKQENVFIQLPQQKTMQEKSLFDIFQTQQPAIEKISTNSFKIELQNPYYQQLLLKKTSNLEALFNREGTRVEMDQSPTQLSIRYVEMEKFNIFIYSFKLNCSYSVYNGILNDYTLQKGFDNNIEEYKLLEMISANTRINYLAYKKVLIVSPRDFVYLKYSYNHGKDFYDIAFSFPYQNPSEGKIRGQIILNASKVIEFQNSIQVHVYTEVDMKLSVNPRLMRNQGVNQIKKYVDKCDKFIKQNYRKG